MRVPLGIAWTASIASIVLATLPALVHLPSFDLSAILQLYDPIIAVLTATLIAVIWYSYFTFKSVHQVEETKAAEKQENVRQLASSLVTIRAQILGLKNQLDFWHKPNTLKPLDGFEVRYVDSEMKKLEDQIISLNHLTARVPASSQADVDVALVHLRFVGAGLQPLLRVLQDMDIVLKGDKVSQQVNDTISGFGLVVDYFQSAIDRLASEDQPLSKEVAEYFRAFSYALGESPHASSDPPENPSS